MTNFLKNSIRQPLLWVLLLFFVLPLLAFPEIVFGEKTLYLADLSWIHYPRHIFAAQEWLAGRIPLWDPFQHNGLPFLAETQVGALYLFSALFLSPLSPSIELSLFILLHFSLAAVFTCILARSLKMSTAAAVVAGLCFGFGGFLMAQVTNLNIMTGAVWLPLILYGIIQTTRRRTWLAAMLAGIPLALQIFTAQPQIVFYTLLTVCGYALYRVTADFFSNDSPHKKNYMYALRTLLLLAVAVVTGLLLAAPQLLPTLELQQLSVRSTERAWDFLTNNSLAPGLLFNLLIPGAFGNNVVGFPSGDPFQEDFIYLGFIPLLLIFFSFEQHRKRDMLFFVILLVGGLLMAAGRYTPLYQYVIQYLPGFALFRIPARWLMVVNLAMAILAGFGLETLRHKGVSKFKLIFMLAASISVVVGLGLVWIFGDTLQQWSQNSWSSLNQKLLAAFLNNGFAINPIYEDRLLMGRLIGLTVPALLLIANIIVAVILFTLYAMRKISANVFNLLVIAALSLDLIAAGGTVINPVQPDDWWHRLSGGAEYVLQNVESARVFPLGMGSEEATVSHLGQYFPSVYRVMSAGGHGSSLMLNRTSTFLKEAHPVQAIQVLGVRYLLTEGQMGADTAATFPLAYQDDTAFVYENRAPIPRAFMVHQTTTVDSADEALAYFQQNELNPSQTVVLEASSPPPVRAAAANSTAVIAHENPQTVNIDVNAAADGYLVLLDTFYPGWTATIDGETTPVYQANYIGRAIFVPEGKHNIQFNYQPLSFRAGAGLFLLTAIILAGVAAFQKSRFYT